MNATYGKDFRGVLNKVAHDAIADARMAGL